MTSGFPSSHCPTVYGPLNSRRHGRSLGINLGLVETKVCTWGCIYCQCGVGERRDIQPGERVLDAHEILKQARDAIKISGPIDSVTLAGNSEPTSHPDFLAIVQGLLDLRGGLKGSWVVNCLSNGSELDQDTVVRACGLLDETWIKFDCAVDDMFQRFNRPIARVGTVGEHVRRIERLQHVFIQTLVWTCPDIPGISNWTEKNREALLEVYSRLKPKQIHLTTVARAPAVSKIQAVSRPEMEIFSSKAGRSGLSVEVFE